MTRIAYLATLIAVAALAQNSKPIFDGRLTLRPGKLSASEEKLFTSEIVPDARKEWRKRERESVCEADFKPAAIDIAPGSFTAPGSAQKAILYKYCTFGHGMALDGIAVIENDRVLAHILFEGGENNAIGALPDINANGLSEMAIAGGMTNQGITSAWISIIEIAPGGVARLGQVETYSDNCGVEENNCKTTANRISVVSGKTPAFYRESFVNKKSMGRAPIALDKDEVQYELLR
jgi:hypothetical protein